MNEATEKPTPHLPTIAETEDAMRAMNQSSEFKFEIELCTCDASVGHCPCSYCCEYDVLRKLRNYLLCEAKVKAEKPEGAEHE